MHKVPPSCSMLAQMAAHLGTTTTTTTCTMRTAAVHVEVAAAGVAVAAAPPTVGLSVWETDAGRQMSKGTLDPATVTPALLRELMRPGPGADTETETVMAVIAAVPPTMSDGAELPPLTGPDGSLSHCRNCHMILPALSL